mgnify:CR=1 FL=1
MPQHQSRRKLEITRLLAMEAARLMAEEGVQDVSFAKRKAAARLKITDPCLFPKNDEIETAQLEYQRLFQSTSHAAVVRELRLCAAHWMRQLRPYNPHLVGAVLSGVADSFSGITLHVFAEHAEQVLLRLLELGTKPRHSEKKVTFAAGLQLTYPSFQFSDDYLTLEVVVFPVEGSRQSPLSPIDHKPTARANLSKVLDLLKCKSPDDVGRGFS